MNNEIKPEIIINGFKKSDISVKEDGSEDEACLDYIVKKWIKILLITFIS